jgi:glycosyltransferase involved in cell wall biosynthesis
MSDLKVLHVLNHVRATGNGIVNAVVDLACEQVQHGMEVAVGSSGGSYEELLAEHGVEHVRIVQDRHLRSIADAGRDLRRAVRARQIDIVHAHMNFTTAFCWAGTRGMGVPLVATAHTSFKRSAALMGLADRVIAVSDRVADEMRRRGCPRRKLVVVPNGTIGSARLSAPPAHIDLERPSVVTVCGMYERKGIDVLIRAFAQVLASVPDAVLHLVGEGPGRATFEALAAELMPADRVRFHGFQSDPRPYLGNADVFVLPSRHDPSPLVIVEAREAGCAIVASAVDGIPQACDWGEAALLVPSEDVLGFADAITRLLRDDADRRALQARASSGLDAFTMRRVALDVERVYRGLLGGPS